MNKKLNINLEEQLKIALIHVLTERKSKDLKKLDWLSLNSDFYINNVTTGVRYE